MPLSASGPLPKCKTMLTCERTVIDAQTGMPSLFNVFFKFRIPSQPGLTIPFSLFVQLTGGLGEYEFAAEFHDLEEGKTLRRAVGNIREPGRVALEGATHAGIRHRTAGSSSVGATWDHPHEPGRLLP